MLKKDNIVSLYMRIVHLLYSSLIPVLILSFSAVHTFAQDSIPLKLPAAVDAGIRNYQSIQAKRNYLAASQSLVKNSRNEYLPNVIAAAQQNYGTVNGQFGPLAPVGVLGASSAGPVSSDQSWNAAFGALYVVSTNWEAYTFGRVRSRIKLADKQVSRDSADLEQEEFVHAIRITDAYLNLLIAQQLIRNAQSNLERAEFIQKSVQARTRTGLNPGVDSSLANAEVSRARLSLIDMRTREQQVQNQLAQYMNVTAGHLVPDTLFFSRLPAALQSSRTLTENPQVRFYQARIEQAEQAAVALKKSIMPSLALFGIYQARASGFDYDYTPATENYSGSYSDGINPSRYNYVVGVSLTWNLLSPFKVKQQATAQKYVAEAYRNEYDQISMQLKNQLILADQRLENSMESTREVPLQYHAASDAFQQKNVLYKNGLTTIVDLQQAMYALNRAETDQSVAYINVWQALLLKAAAAGDFDLFINQVP